MVSKPRQPRADWNCGVSESMSAVQQNHEQRHKVSRPVSPAVLDRFNTDDVPLIEDHLLWCQRRNYATTTIRSRINRLAQIAEQYPDRSLLDVTSEQIESALDQSKGRYGGSIQANSRKAAISNLRSFYKWAIDFGWTTDSPMRQVVSPRVGHQVPTPVGENDYQLALAAAPTELVRLWLLLGGSVGLRCGEISSLEWAGIDLNERTLRVVGKGNRERVVPLIFAVCNALESHQRTRTSDSEFVFTDAVFDRPYQPSQVSKNLGLFFAEIGMAYTAHDLRHRFGTEACESSGDIRAVQVLMGHKSIESTAAYTLVRDKRRRQIVDGMRGAA